ncbi:unnamed protein product [Sphagnum troendelagicum]
MFLRVWRFLGLGLGFQKVPVGRSRSRKTEGTSRQDEEQQQEEEEEEESGNRGGRRSRGRFGECLEIIRVRVAEVPVDSSRRRKKREGSIRQEEERRNRQEEEEKEE